MNYSQLVCLHMYLLSFPLSSPLLSFPTLPALIDLFSFVDFNIIVLGLGPAYLSGPSPINHLVSCFDQVRLLARGLD